MKNMKLSTKLIGGFVIVAVIAAIIGVVGFWSLNVAKTAQDDAAAVFLPSIYGLEVMNEAQTAILLAERTLCYEKDAEIVKRQNNNLDAAWKRVDEGWKIYEPLRQTADEEVVWKKLVQEWGGWKKSHQDVISLVKKGDLNAARTSSFGKTRELFSKAEKSLNEVININIKNSKESTAAFDKSSGTITLAFGLLIILGVAISLFLGIYLSLSIIRALNKVISGLGEASDQVSAAAGEVSAASQSLAEGSSQQAASVEETSSSLEEMSSMTKQNASNAGQADSLMKQANQVVNNANMSMSQLTTSMREISNASEETSKIIKTIDEIAFQTNLLALNAAVEAARAGEAGAGFAVVADEVRNLAMRAAEAAKNTAALIEGTVKKVTEGTALVKTTNDAFKEVAGSAAKVGELVGEIAAASTEQAQGIEQVNIAVTEMDKVTQQNAATAEESASASEELNAQAEEMKGFVADLAAMVGGKVGVSTRSLRTVDHPKVAIHVRQSPQKAVTVVKKPAKGKALSLHRPEEIHSITSFQSWVENGVNEL
ncbi:MAG: MCP four helix bundle domain-containing protein [Deltaproteobacteria bacterium]|nr:MCP four helix bundle domain-containing protein [Deltaproteobacteria bacterium]